MQEENQGASQEQVPSAESTENQEQIESQDQGQVESQDEPKDTGAEDQPQGQVEEQSSPRLERRMERVAQKYGPNEIRQVREQANQYRQQLYQTDPNYQPIKYDTGEYDAQQLEQDRASYGNFQFAQGRQTAASDYQQEMFVDRLELDTERVVSKYDGVFDKSSDNYDPDLDTGLTNLYLQTVGFDPNTGTIQNTKLRFKDFVDTQMKLIDRAATSRNANSTQNLAKQASRTGTRPTSTRKSSIDLTDPNAIANMSPAEYEKHKDEIQAHTLRLLGVKQ